MYASTSSLPVTIPAVTAFETVVLSIVPRGLSLSANTADFAQVSLLYVRGHNREPSRTNWAEMKAAGPTGTVATNSLIRRFLRRMDVRTAYRGVPGKRADHNRSRTLISPVIGGTLSARGINEGNRYCSE